MREVVGCGGVPGDGPYIKVSATIGDQTLCNCRCICNGCATAVEMCNFLTKLIEGRDPSKLQSLELSDMHVLFPNVGEGKGFYRDLALEAILALCKQCLKAVE